VLQQGESKSGCPHSRLRIEMREEWVRHFHVRWSFLKFDEQGNQKIADLLKASSQKDHLPVNVDGEVQGDTIKVQSINLS